MSPDRSTRRRRRFPVSAVMRVVRVEDDPADLNRVRVTDRAGNVASVTIDSYRETCHLEPRAEVHTLRLLTTD